ncbi:Protein QmcA (possibly involved in integral membrane quality control) [uncultured Coleofasciculus sp.]|uniref:Protein QmcA (Possibly involved in integral membrane quality control) n=1 Tax=uncultured Coleofasciculus sp. TaxID=1267456 RepID=A0A6J4JB90_9CYAN|nr:Protein QmcA (possibly involved in integral membrane quality control) [uncultured Coleofasciculus sp.]
MDPVISILAPMILVIIGYTIGSTKIVNEGNQALVERLGKFHKKLDPGLNYIIPFLDRIAVEDTVREQVLDIPPQQAITRDNISLEVDAVVLWKVLDLKEAYYAVEDVELAIQNLVTTALRSMIGELDLSETYSSRATLNQKLLRQLDEATAGWGVKVTRIELQEIKPPKTILESLEQERAAESQKQATISQAQGTVKSIQILSEALQSQTNSQQILQFLIAERYVDANQKLGESANSKVVFMDPKALSEALSDLISTPDAPVDANMTNGLTKSSEQ